MSEPLVANSYVLKIRDEEKMAVIRAQKIKKKEYIIIIFELKSVLPKLDNHHLNL